MPWRGSDDPDEFPSLGWQLLDWWSDYLANPRDETQPLVFTNEQALTLVEWYEIHPVTGHFVHRRGASRRSKGRGKSPVEGAKAIAELAGDVLFDGWDADGEPVGRPWGTKGAPTPWVQIAAVSEDQTDNTYSAIYEFLMANDGRAADELRIDTGLTRCYLRDRPGRLEPVTAAAGTREGQRVTYGVLDETHLWTPSNGGKRLARTLRRNVAKMGGRTYETTNAFVPGEDSVAEGTDKAVIEGAAGIYYDAVEAPEVKFEDSDATLRSALRVAYGDAWWVDLDRIVAEIRDPESTWEDSQRFYFNHNVDDRRKAVETKRWENLARDGRDDAHPKITVPAGAYIGLGFDGSLSDDTTALIGTIVVDGVPHGFEIEVWSRPPGAPKSWRVPRAEIRARVTEAFAFWNVGLMLCDPAKWQTEIEFWAEEFGEERVVFFDTNQPARMWKACDRFSTALAEDAYTHDGSAIYSAHVLAMHKRKVRVRDDDADGRTKFVFVKGPNRDKIDAGIGGVLALEAAMTMPPFVPFRPAPAPMVDSTGTAGSEMAGLATAGF
jgi:hypothetical protein